MTVIVPRHKRGIFRLGVLLIAFACLPLYSWWAYQGIPARETLSAITGTVEWIESGRRGVRFKLHCSPCVFHYGSKSGATSLVRETLARPDRPAIGVLYRPSKTFLAGDDICNPYELSANGEVFRSYAAVGTAWDDDQAVAPWLGGIFLAAGVVFAFFAMI